MNAVRTSEKCVARMFAATGIVAFLVFTVACGSSGNGGGGGGQNGNFSDSSLKGNYAYTMHGWSSPDGFTPAPFVEGGVFIADGNGNVTSGADDFVIGSQAGLNNPTTGTYRINND